jgi:hypothetical protein
MSGFAFPGVVLFEYKEVIYHGYGNCSETFGKTDEQE